MGYCSNIVKMNDYYVFMMEFFDGLFIVYGVWSTIGIVEYIMKSMLLLWNEFMILY